MAQGEFASGQVIVGSNASNKYRIVGLIAQGGQGAVYKAEEIVDGMVARIVAIKTIIAGLVSQPGFLTRFVREASVMLRLKSPNSVRIIDFFQHEGSWCIAMEWLTGSTLTNELARIGIMEPTQALSIATQICDAIGEAHVLGIIHRDLKPDNIFVRPTSVSTYSVKVCDFGLASAQPGDERATNAGAVMGTPGYMSPEQANGQDTTPASDVYAIGAILFEMVVGHAPFQGSWMEKVVANARDEHPKLPPDILATTAGPLMQIIVDRCTRRDPSLRYQTCGELRVKLDEALARLPRLGRGSSTMALQVLPDSQPGTVGVIQAHSSNTPDSGGVIVAALPDDPTIGPANPSQPRHIAAVPAGVRTSSPDLPTFDPDAPVPITDRPTEAVSRPNLAASRISVSRPAVFMPMVVVPSEPSAPQAIAPPALTRPMRTTPLPIPAKRPTSVPLTTIVIVCVIALLTAATLWYLHGKIEAKAELLQNGGTISTSVEVPAALIATPVANSDTVPATNEVLKSDPPVKAKSQRFTKKSKTLLGAKADLEDLKNPF